MSRFDQSSLRRKWISDLAPIVARLQIEMATGNSQYLGSWYDMPDKWYAAQELLGLHISYPSEETFYVADSRILEFYKKNGLLRYDDPINVLADVCDHARTRDFQGYGKTTHFEGHRLSAASRANKGWNLSDIKSAKDILYEHRVQAARLLAGNAYTESDLLAIFEAEVDLPAKRFDSDTFYLYAGMSPSKNNILIYIPDDRQFDGVVSDLRRGLQGLMHGTRYISLPEQEKKAKRTVHGSSNRYVLPMNGTVQAALLAFFSEHRFVVDGNFETAVNKEIDSLLKNPIAAFVSLHRDKKFGERPYPCLCFSADDKYEEFVNKIKSKEFCQSRFRLWCEEDMAWYFMIDHLDTDMLRDIVSEYGVACSDEVMALMRSTPNPFI